MKNILKVIKQVRAQVLVFASRFIGGLTPILNCVPGSSPGQAPGSSPGQDLRLKKEAESGAIIYLISIIRGFKGGNTMKKLLFSVFSACPVKCKATSLGVPLWFKKGAEVGAIISIIRGLKGGRMMKKSAIVSLTILTFAFCLLPFSDVVAEVPGLLNYQGKLTNADGTLVTDGNYQLNFNLCDQVTDGTSWWSETHPAVDVTNGLFNVLLGSTDFAKQTGLIDTFQKNNSLYLEISVQGETLSPRQEMAAVGYAMRMAGITVKDGKVGIGTDNPTETLDVAGVIKSSEGLNISAGTVALPAGTITSTYIANGTLTNEDFASGSFGNITGLGELGSLTVTGNTYLATTSGNVGIGTTVPGAKLHINQTTAGTSAIKIQHGDGTHILFEENTGTDIWQINRLAGTNDMEFNSLVAGDFVFTGGNVGIGTTGPDSRLHIRGAPSQIGGITIESSAGTTADRLAIYGMSNYGSTFQKLQVGGSIEFKDSSGNSELIIAGTGNIGIGSDSTPDCLLDVQGTFNSNGQTHLASTSGNVGIGTTGPGERLSVNGNVMIGDATWVQETTSGDLAIQGNVGIGTADPGAKLEVNGQVKIIGGSPGADKVLTSDPNGLASWQAAGGVPSGVIAMWSGLLANIPSGWALCDGTGGTPDLKDRFIYGTSASEEPGATGGATSHSHSYTQVPKHSHTASCSTDGAHSHSMGRDDQGGSAGEGYNIPGTPDNHAWGGPTSTAGNHSHTITVAETGDLTCTTLVASSLPPYYKLAFIMKL